MAGNWDFNALGRICAQFENFPAGATGVVAPISDSVLATEGLFSCTLTITRPIARFILD